MTTEIEENIVDEYNDLQWSLKYHQNKLEYIKVKLTMFEKTYADIINRDNTQK